MRKVTGESVKKQGELQPSLPPSNPRLQIPQVRPQLRSHAGEHLVQTADAFLNSLPIKLKAITVVHNMPAWVVSVESGPPWCGSLPRSVPQLEELPAIYAIACQVQISSIGGRSGRAAE